MIFILSYKNHLFPDKIFRCKIGINICILTSIRKPGPSQVSTRPLAPLCRGWSWSHWGSEFPRGLFVSCLNNDQAGPACSCGSLHTWYGSFRPVKADIDVIPLKSLVVTSLSLCVMFMVGFTVSGSPSEAFVLLAMISRLQLKKCWVSLKTVHTTSVSLRINYLSTVSS